MATGYTSEGIQELVTELKQPVTAKQWSRMSGTVFEQCRQIFVAARRKGLIQCINPDASRHRLYFFTIAGLKYQKQIRRELGLDQIEHDLPEIDWKLYGECCYPHRSAVIKTLSEPMQSCTCRRIAVRNDPSLRMSSGNVREVMGWLKKQGIVQSFKIRKNPYPLHELTELGQHLRRLLKQAEAWL